MGHLLSSRAVESPIFVPDTQYLSTCSCNKYLNETVDMIIVVDKDKRRIEALLGELEGNDYVRSYDSAGCGGSHL